MTAARGSAPPPRQELALYLPGGRVAPPENPYGRHVANAGVFRALARCGGLRRVHVLCRQPPSAADLARELLVDAGDVEVSVGPLLGTDDAARSGVLLYGQPYLREPAWIRRHAGRERAYSIVGTVFAYASAPHRQEMTQAMLAPVHPWDALVCSSPSLAGVVARTLDEWEDHLRERLGSADLRLPRPQLPVIPFGTDVAAIEAQSRDRVARAALRASLGVGEDDVLVLFLGRLSYYDKAFPQAMLKALQAARDAGGPRLHFAMTGWFPEGDRDRERFEEAARAHAPGVPTSFLDGNDPGVVAQCWAAADIFLLLSDTILETFGQALVEAMAAGLPVVASDWDGYRSIVRDGQDGFLVPTLGAPAGPLGETLALLESVEQVAYSQYAGATAQHTAVDVRSAANALARLAASPELRRTMGEDGRRRARARFDWPVVADEYLSLFAELDRLRDGAPRDETPARHRLDPLRADPFDTFGTLPTRVLDDDMPVRLGTGPWAHPRAMAELDAMFPGMRGTGEEAAAVLDRLAAEGPMRVGTLLEAFPARRRPFVRMSVMWLAKAGRLEWGASDPG